MPIFTKRWNDTSANTDGWRILICRYRPRALKKSDETWDAWFSQLGPSPKLHADAYGKHRSQPISYAEYQKRYLKEMQNKNSRDLINCLSKYVDEGGTITLLCSSACNNEKTCHRTLLKKLMLSELDTKGNVKHGKK